MPKSRTTLAAAILLTLVMLTTDLGAPAIAAVPSAPQPARTTLGTGGIGNSPLSTQEQKQRAEAKRHDHPQGANLNHLGEDGKHLAATDSRSPKLADGAAATTTVDPVTWAECEGHSYDDQDNAYWFKNKYNLCRLELFTLTYRELIDNTVVEVGKTMMVVEVKGTATAGASSITFDMRMRDFQDFDTTHKEWPMSIQLPCTNADPSRTSTCSEFTGHDTVYRQSIAEWEAQAGTEYHWTKNTATTANPDTTYHAEMRGFFEVGLYFLLESPLGPDVSVSPTAISRCDSATYVNGSKCIFPTVASVLEFSASDPAISESAQFIRDAQTDITLTKPGTPGKRVPGGLNDLPLHRLYSAYDFKNDIKASRRRVPKTCRLYWGPKYTLGGTRQCDEYPFATTYENSARINTHSLLDYAVRAIKKEHNETAGQRYGAWLGSDHILDGDPFYVRITP
jgi:hypothetical protein